MDWRIEMSKITSITEVQMTWSERAFWQAKYHIKTEPLLGWPYHIPSDIRNWIDLNIKKKRYDDVSLKNDGFHLWLKNKEDIMALKLRWYDGSSADM